MLNGIGNCGSCSGYLQQQAMGRSDPSDLFDKVDSDASGGISQTELEAWAGAMSDETGVSIDTADAVSTWDEDGDGVLNDEELASFMRETMPPPPGNRGMGPAASAEGLFQALDADESTGISESELTQWAENMSEETGNALDVSSTFSDYDLDGDGELSSSELDSFLTENGIGAPEATAAERQEEENTGVGTADSESVISEYDTNGDGVLSGDELQAYLDDTEASAPRAMMREAISSYEMNFENNRQFDFQDVFMNSGATDTYSPLHIPA